MINSTRRGLHAVLYVFRTNHSRRHATGFKNGQRYIIYCSGCFRDYPTNDKEWGKVMAASLGDLIQFVDRQTYLGEDLLNVYYYRITSLTGLSDPYLPVLAEWFRDNVITPVLDIQNNGLVHTTLDARNLSNNIDVAELVVDLPGANTAADTVALPSWMTVNFKLIRESLATRNGSKRFSGLVESQSTANSYAIPPLIQTAIEEALAADIVLSLVTVAEPVIVRRPIVPPVGTSYTYASIGAAVYTAYGTQNTRKP